MSTKLLLAVSFSAISTMIFLKSFPVVGQENKLILEDKGYPIENSIEIEIPPSHYQRLKSINDNNLSLKDVVFRLNGHELPVNDIHTRGSSSLQFRRKSYSISLDQKADLRRKNGSDSMKKFYSISLSMDKNYIRNRIAFGLLENMGIFHLFYSYGELNINGQSEGIYMLLERPQDWAIKKQDAPFVIRRGYENKIDEVKTGKKVDKTAVRQYKDNYKMIYKSLSKYEGKALYDTLSQWLDLEMYMQWLAFNFFVKNGDYTDEIFFCIDPSTDRFVFIPWDYDDIFALEPHEGFKARKSTIGDKQIFSSEDKLDQKIANDPFLYDLYLSELREMLLQLSEEVLKDIFEEVFAELYPYFSNNEIISMAQHDLYKEASLNTLIKQLNALYNALCQSRKAYLSILPSKDQKR